MEIYTESYPGVFESVYNLRKLYQLPMHLSDISIGFHLLFVGAKNNCKRESVRAHSMLSKNKSEYQVILVLYGMLRPC